MFRRLARVLPTALSLCDQWNRTRRPFKGVPRIDTTDVMLCSAKYYGMRVIDPAQTCKTLTNLMKGQAIQEQLIPYLQSTGLQVKKQYLADVQVSTPDGDMKFELTGTPDLVDQDLPTKLIQIKMHQMDKGVMSMITAEQHNFLESILSYPRARSEKLPEIPHITKAIHPELYALYGSYYPVYISDMVELIALDQLASFPYCNKIKRDPEKICDTKRKLSIMEVLRDGTFDIPLDRGDIYGLWSWFWDYLEASIFAFYASNQNQNFDQTIFDNLVAHEICQFKMTRSFQCLDCPFRTVLNLCKGMPPLRKHRKKTDGYLYDMVDYWRKKRVRVANPPTFEEEEDYIDDNGRMHKGINRTGWKSTIQWTRGFQLTVCDAHHPLEIYLQEMKLRGPFV